MVGWEFEVLDRLNILKFMNKRMLLVYTLGAGGGFFQVTSYLAGWGFNFMSLQVAIGLIVVLTVILVYFYPLYRRMTSVRVQQDGLRYGSRSVITWDEMKDVAFIWEDGLPYISMKKKSDIYGEYHIPLYLDHLDSFRTKLCEVLPKSHPIEKLVPEIERLRLSEISDRAKWWHI